MTTYGITGIYIFLKFFRKVDQESEFSQKIALTFDEFVDDKKTGRIDSAADNATENNFTLKAPYAKKAKWKQQDDEHEISDWLKEPEWKKVEAMYERWLRQAISENFRFCISEEKPKSRFAKKKMLP